MPLPHAHWKTTTLVVGLTSEGFVAPCVTDGAMNGRLFRAWMEQALVPILQPGDVVIVDNLSCHKSAAVREANLSHRPRTYHVELGLRLAEQVLDP